MKDEREREKEGWGVEGERCKGFTSTEQVGLQTIQRVHKV